MRKPTMKSPHEFVDYLATHLGRVRCLKALSRKDAYFVQLDERMGDRWSSVINGRSPSPEQRAWALQERLNVGAIYPRIEAAIRQLLTICHSLAAYAVALPLPTPAGNGWETRADLIHPDNIIKTLTIAIDDVRCLSALDPENAFFKDLWEQIQEMARWTRTSLNPSAEDRAKVKLNQLTLAQLELETQKILLSFCEGFHDFCELYAAFPTQ
ncbi:MAG: hypothetical protein QM770_16495 [Tepidisphaeraceae bacterium]